MKISILTISLLSAVALFTTACGGGDDDTDIKDITVDYTTTAQYDLSKYLVSTQDQINNYVEKEYIDDTGKKKYDDTAEETIYHANKFDINGTTIKEYNNDDLETTYTILTDKITEYDEEDKSLTNIARYADEGDYIIKIDKTIEEDGLSIALLSACKLSKHLDSKDINGKTYQDILELTCEGSGTSAKDAKLNGISYSIKAQITTKTYMAKDNGMIWEEDETCTDIVLNEAKSKKCEKTITEITTIN